ncbi:hypothetical protein RP20_CCG003000 [Aedes albopictus]|nr:hypothetical protein RP20_CCG003000 [Aedes albopictus]
MKTDIQTRELPKNLENFSIVSNRIVDDDDDAATAAGSTERSRRGKGSSQDSRAADRRDKSHSLLGTAPLTRNNHPNPLGYFLALWAGLVHAGNTSTRLRAYDLNLETVHRMDLRSRILRPRGSTHKNANELWWRNYGKQCLHSSTTPDRMMEWMMEKNGATWTS